MCVDCVLASLRIAQAFESRSRIVNIMEPNPRGLPKNFITKLQPISIHHGLGLQQARTRKIHELAKLRVGKLVPPPK
jgi:hypothetical protein